MACMVSMALSPCSKSIPHTTTHCPLSSVSAMPPGAPLTVCCTHATQWPSVSSVSSHGCVTPHGHATLVVHAVLLSACMMEGGGEGSGQAGRQAGSCISKECRSGPGMQKQLRQAQDTQQGFPMWSHEATQMPVNL
jgi:hypothetical protein